MLALQERMSFPNFKDKHVEEALFNPDDYIKWTKFKKKHTQLPKKYIIVYYSKLLKQFKREYKPSKTKIHHLMTIYTYKNIGLVHMTGIGAPHSAAVFEELIALGGKEFLNIGSAGGLDGLGVFVCDKAVRDEGTSYHYIPHQDFAYPSKELSERLKVELKKVGLPFEIGTTWTIDAPYRETRAEVQHYKKSGVKTVEMEASALFTVAQVRKVKIAAAFVVSDVLGEKKWDPQFDAKHVKQKMNQLLDASVSCLLKK